MSSWLARSSAIRELCFVWSIAIGNIFLQDQALQNLSEHAVITYKLLTDKNRRIRRIITRFNNRRGTFQNFLFDCHHGSSNVQMMIERYSDSDTLWTSRPLVTKPDGIKYLKTPCNGYISKWSDGFYSCLVCDSLTHRFAFCSDKGNIDVKTLFWWTLSAYSFYQEKEERPYSSCT